LENFEPSGDPGLVEFVKRQRPEISRPDRNSPEAVRFWQQSLRRRLIELFELQDIRSAVDVRTQRLREETVAPGLRRIFVSYESFDGTTIPGYLFIPADSGPRPAIIVLNGHTEADELGIMQTAGIVDSYQRGAALSLAKAGFVTLTIEFRGFGYLGARIGAEHRLVSYNALLGGSFYKSVLAKDIKYALSYLQSLPNVSAGRIGITGVSYGAEMAVTYAALDERIKAVVSQGFGGGLGVEPGVAGARRTEKHPYYYHLIPGHNKHVLQEDMFLLIIPRPLLAVWGEHDYFGSPDFFKTMVQSYASFEAGDRLSFETVKGGGHEYFIDPAVRFFRRHL
jgi:dienelactone hydrolase